MYAKYFLSKYLAQEILIGSRLLKTLKNKFHNITLDKPKKVKEIITYNAILICF